LSTVDEKRNRKIKKMKKEKRKKKNRSVNFSPINAVSYSSPKNIQQKNYIMMEITRTKKARVNPPFKD